MVRPSRLLPAALLFASVQPLTGQTWEVRFDPNDPRTVYAATEGQGVFGLTHLDRSPCEAGETTLCLNQGRFEVQVAWEDFQGGRGLGHAVNETADSGWFWFFDPANVELLVKALDGRAVNDKFWLFYGSLSNVAYTITVRDTETGEVKVYPNPAFRFASVGDTAAFPTAGAALSTESASPWLSFLPGLQIADMEAPDECLPDATTLCLQDGRFRVQVHWRDFQGGRGVGHAIPLAESTSGDSGFFWFFHPDNLELVVKVLDGRTVNGNFWLFYGALSNVEYEVDVTDVESGRRAVYSNPSGRFASVGDTETFDGSTFCGGIAGFPCPQGQICDPDPASCQVADVGGRCKILPEVCPQIFQPVCGCDGITYGNDCERLRAGVAKDRDGACEG